MNDKVSTTGIWGITRSGKTALVAHICHKLLEAANCDIEVIWVTVSQNININRLQNNITESLKLDISDEPRERIASKLFQAFKEMKKCVIVLHNGDHFSLKDIRFSMLDNRITLILTTRFREVCQNMYCEKVMNIEPLDGENSWALFDKFVADGFAASLNMPCEKVMNVEPLDGENSWALFDKFVADGFPAS
ncbi:probable disease resistance protein At1g52660 [Neltuma alba]|uniref:probable disease resistance protein At1g52660 n=1 Tax=Neltuma alba TaxID=207710 RepID=UPI0010A52B4E|nr:probable disease resistance protein At1g52660 [Prosopis alba]